MYDVHKFRTFILYNKLLTSIVAFEGKNTPKRLLRIIGFVEIESTDKVCPCTFFLRRRLNIRENSH